MLCAPPTGPIGLLPTAMSTRIFGTDGVRGPAGVGPLSPTSLVRLGRAVARGLAHRTGRRVLIGRDTRVSGPAVQAAMAAGLLAEGVAVDDGGVLPTPAIAFLTRRHGYGAGLVVSASHNPWQDNGVKVLGPGGAKLSDADEAAVESAYAALADEPDAASDGYADAGRLAGAASEYADAVVDEFGADALAGLRLVADCANGAQSAIAGTVLRRLGAVVEVLHAEPDGRNVNDGCGALHTESLQARVTELGADAGVAFDGDADRVQLIDERGELVDGDAILAILAPLLREREELADGVVVGTSMTNGALAGWLEERDMRLVRTAVGDRHIVRCMTEHGYGLGAEPSGHVLLPWDGLLSGDGLRAAVACLVAARSAGHSLSAAPDGFRPWPLELVSFRVRERTPVAELPGTTAAIEDAERRLGSGGRVVVRYSGTEPKVRVMVEALDPAELRAALDPIVAALREEVGE